jgi:hypothetical protein
MSRSTSPCNPSRCGSQTRAPKTNRDTTPWRQGSLIELDSFLVFLVCFKTADASRNMSKRENR